ncbi:hypothetical protein ESB00_09755 [Oleiharenicola lentus]|uniref:Lipoprotein SmpA/OmlA domain-containing protein n=1 Tax=Oleiharenicola lentus TaxID=2508720 RepID=A0A4Q1CB49_9BACT|nr:hypothetical protein [Oleiharenicola lentus]RXK56136.1 hypothetical protein ESB00_09755 [Oleiharenicola lentus]
MRRLSVIAALGLGICLGAPEGSAADWSRLKAGLSVEETEAALGRPLIRTYGRGYQVWIYDGRGEVIFSEGPGAMGWSLPAPTPESLSRPVERDVLLKPRVRLPALRSAAATEVIPVVAPENDIRFRYLPRR